MKQIILVAALLALAAPGQHSTKLSTHKLMGTPAPSPVSQWAQGWTAIPNTDLRSHTPSGCSDGYSFHGKANFIYDQWSGGVADTKNNRLLIWGGGHRSGFDNGVYALNVGTDAAHSSMSQLVASTCLTNWRWRETSASDNGLNIDGSGPCSTYSSACNPNARQTYDALVYDPVHHKMIDFGGVPAWNGGNWDTYVWELDLTTNTWTRYGTVSHGGSAGMITSSWNPNTNTAWYYDEYVLQEYDPITHKITVKSNTTWTSDYHQTGIIDPTNNVYWVIGNSHMQYIPLSNPSKFHTSSTGGCSGLLRVAYPGLTWNPTLGKVVAYPWTGNTIYIINYNGTSSSCTAQTFTGGPGAVDTGAISYQGTFKRFQYLPQLDVYVVCNQVDSNCYVLRTSRPNRPTSSLGAF